VTGAERYLQLGLRLGKHVDGLVDAYYGPPELKEQVDTEETVPVQQLADDADALLAELTDGWLADQVQGCATYAHVLAGDDISYSDEVEGCYGVRPSRVSEDVYRAVHDELDALLPGDGSLFERRQAWRERHLVRGDVALPVLQERAEEWRRQVTEAFMARYRTAVAGARSMPAAPGTADALLEFFMLEKALYEIDYELAQRPVWAAIPLAGVLAVVEGDHGRA